MNTYRLGLDTRNEGFYAQALDVTEFGGLPGVTYYLWRSPPSEGTAKFLPVGDSWYPPFVGIETFRLAPRFPYGYSVEPDR